MSVSAIYRLLCLLIAAFVSGSIVQGQVYSQIVGAIAVDVPAASDVVVAFPFKQSASYRGVVESVLDDGNLNIAVAADSLTSGAYDSLGGTPTHYIVVTSGAEQGKHVGVVSNTASSIALPSGVLTDLIAGDAIEVFPHWTLGSAFPYGVANHDETEPGLRQIEVILPQSISPAGGMIPEGIFYFHGGNWRQVGEGVGSVVDSTVLHPGRAFVIRNNGALAKTALFYGEVTDAPIAIPLSESTEYASENFVGLNRPLPIALDDLGLAGGGVFQATTDPADIKDALLVYSQTDSGKNKQPIAMYYHYAGAWREASSDPSVNKGGDTIAPGMGMAIRKVAVASDPAEAFWVNQWQLP